MKNIIKNTHQKISDALQCAIDDCKKLTKSERSDLAHECSERMTTARGTESAAVKIVSDVLVALIES